jgi:flagellar biosynthesis protein FliR
LLDQLVPENLFALLLVFARVGSTIMLLPGFGEVFVSARIRLLLALAISIVIAPVVIDTLPRLPEAPVAVLMLVGGEVAIGLFLGGLARLLISALHMAGVIIGFQASLGNATLFDPSTAQQGSTLGAFFNVVGVILIFAADLHYLMLRAVADSYSLFVPGAALPVGDFSEIAARTMATSFTLAMQIAAPLIVVGLVFYLGLGLLARLMPQVQVFFIAIPLQIMLAFIVLALTLSASMMWFLSAFEARFIGLLGGV